MTSENFALRKVDHAARIEGALYRLVSGKQEHLRQRVSDALTLFWYQFDDVKSCEHCQRAASTVVRDIRGDREHRPKHIYLAHALRGGKCLGPCTSDDKKLELLAHMAAAVFSKPLFQQRRGKRSGFNKHKSLGMIKHSPECFVCLEASVHRHHIIQIQHGGVNTWRNQVPLCEPCHRKVHSMAKSISRPYISGVYLPCR